MGIQLGMFHPFYDFTLHWQHRDRPIVLKCSLSSDLCKGVTHAVFPRAGTIPSLVDLFTVLSARHFQSCQQIMEQGQGHHRSQTAWCSYAICVLAYTSKHFGKKDDKTTQIAFCISFKSSGNGLKYQHMFHIVHLLLWNLFQPVTFVQI